ncbi:MAG TPA: putative phage abortive infection protein [Bacteroidota bacterium]|nr:putative phage abortive infection protein [Bacteroidota bacterium]
MDLFKTLRGKVSKDNSKQNSQKSKKNWATFDKQFWYVFAIFLFFLFVICWFPFLFTQFSNVNYNLKEYGPLGDALNGIMGPFIAMLAAALTFIAFWVQYKANNQQRDDINLERFENKFYELVRMQNNTVDAFKIANEYSGRKVFLAMYNELRFCFFSIKHELEQVYHDHDQETLGFKKEDDKEIFQIAYLIFFYGIGDISDKLLQERLKNLCSPWFAGSIIRYLKKQGKGLHVLSMKDGARLRYEAKYKPFDGHISRLGHYYRLLFQAVKFVNGNDILTKDEKYNYVKTLRAQLSAHEQVMLYYNTMTHLGEAWLAGVSRYDSLLIKYKMIKNIPLPLADFGYPIQKEFEVEVKRYEEENPGRKFYEWDGQEVETPK